MPKEQLLNDRDKHQYTYAYNVKREKKIHRFVTPGMKICQRGQNDCLQYPANKKYEVRRNSKDVHADNTLVRCYKDKE